MPRYFIDTFNHFLSVDQEGHDLPDDAAARKLVRKTLAEMMRDEKDGRSAVQLRADVRDGSGARTMTATLLMVIDAAPIVEADG